MFLKTHPKTSIRLLNVFKHVSRTLLASVSMVTSATLALVVPHTNPSVQTGLATICCQEKNTKNYAQSSLFMDILVYVVQHIKGCLLNPVHNFYKDHITWALRLHWKQSELLFPRLTPTVGTPGKLWRGGGGSKVELNPKSKKTPILGHFGTLKNYIHIKHSTLKNTAFFLFNHRHILENYSYIVPHSRHHTLHIHIVNLCFI